MKWEKKAVEQEQVRKISERFKVDLLKSSILVRRGVVSDEAICFYLEDELRFIHNPFLFDEMSQAVERILQAKQEGEKVLIFGDRDVDGIVSTVILTEALGELGIEVSWELPRGDEAYGLSRNVVDQFARNSGSLIITVDCGISNQKEIEYALAKGIETIVIDHHNPPGDLPPASSLINPKLVDSGYPFRDLAGCGVASKVAWALKFSETPFYEKSVCLLNIRPGNGSYVIDAVILTNLVETDRVSETLVPGMVDLNNTRLLPFFQSELVVYEADVQKRMLHDIFGENIEIHLNDIAPEIWNHFPTLTAKSLYRLKEQSRLSKYKGSSFEEIDVLVHLFNAYVLKREELLSKDYLNKLDLVALGTLADMMPLENENRILVKLGMVELNGTTRKGLRELIGQQNLLGKKLSTTDVAWYLSPVINASGRMGQPHLAVELLLSADQSQCELLAGKIIALNKERKKLGQDVWNKILPLAKESYQELDSKMVIVSHKTIQRGITGILATRLVNFFNVPAVVMASLEYKVVGSLRSLGGYGLREILDQCKEFFLDYGGHDFAAGFNLSPEDLPNFLDHLKSVIRGLKVPESRDETVHIDAELPLKFMTPELYGTIEFFEPYGENNPPLVFLIKGVTISGVELMGKNGSKHVRMLIDAGKHKWPAVYWNAAERVGRDFNLYDKVDLVFRVGRNYFQNKETLQLTVIDLQK